MEQPTPDHGVTPPLARSVGYQALNDLDRRLSVVFGALILVLLTLVLVASSLYLRNIMRTEENKLSALVTQVLANAVSRVSFSGKYHARLMLEEIQAAQPEILYLRLVDSQGYVVAHSDAALNDTQVDAAALQPLRQVMSGQTPTALRHLQHQGAPAREVTMVYRGGYDNAPVGVIQVGLSERERSEAVRRGLLFAVLLTAALLVLGVVATRRISAAFGAPVRRHLMLASAVFDASREGLLITDNQLRILRVNPALTRQTGYTEDELLGQTPQLLHSGPEGADLRSEILETLLRQGHWQGEVTDRRKDGSLVPVLLSASVVRDEQGQVLHYVALHADITRLKESEARLEHLAHHDHLTGLTNRLMLHLQLTHAIERAKRQQSSVALLLVDLDHFKDVNDSLGHLMGDALLVEAGQRLLARVRHTDMVSRLGGDEFTVVLEDTANPTEAARVAQDLITELSRPYRLPSGEEVALGATVGIALYPDHGADVKALLQGADAALYQAKAQGRGQYRFFTNELTVAARERIELESRLRAAIDRNELVLHFQPQVDARTGSLVGAEALVRWQSPELGLVMPGRFIAIAEQSTLIEAIGHWVLVQTCRQGRQWLDAGLPGLRLAVNVAPRQFQRADFVQSVESVLRETGFPPQWLELEVTERTLMQEQDKMLQTLRQLRDLGIHIAIDDFGTGYSSLAYLKRFPLDVLKIDKSFVDDLPAGHEDAAIAAAIIGMAHNLGLCVLAEGVECDAQLQFLRERGCDSIQGYRISRPLPAPAFAAYLAVQTSAGACTG